VTPAATVVAHSCPLPLNPTSAFHLAAGPLSVKRLHPGVLRILGGPRTTGLPASLLSFCFFASHFHFFALQIFVCASGLPVCAEGVAVHGRVNLRAVRSPTGLAAPFRTLKPSASKAHRSAVSNRAEESELSAAYDRANHAVLTCSFELFFPLASRKICLGVLDGRALGTIEIVLERASISLFFYYTTTTRSKRAQTTKRGTHLVFPSRSLAAPSRSLDFSYYRSPVRVILAESPMRVGRHRYSALGDGEPLSGAGVGRVEVVQLSSQHPRVSSFTVSMLSSWLPGPPGASGISSPSIACTEANFERVCAVSNYNHVRFLPFSIVFSLPSPLLLFPLRLSRPASSTVLPFRSFFRSFVVFSSPRRHFWPVSRPCVFSIFPPSPLALLPMFFFCPSSFRLHSLLITTTAAHDSRRRARCLCPVPRAALHPDDVAPGCLKLSIRPSLPSRPLIPEHVICLVCRPSRQASPVPGLESLDPCDAHLIIFTFATPQIWLLSRRPPICRAWRADSGGACRP